MTYYADYEALERPRHIIKPHKIPPWLHDTSKDIDGKLLIPLTFSACSPTGKIAHTQEYILDDKPPISFLRFLDSIIKWDFKTKRHKVYFHNLFYDFSIILPELLYNKFTQYVPESEYMLYTRIDILDKMVIDKSKLFFVYGENLRMATGIDIWYRNRIFKLRDTFRIMSSSQNSILKSFGYEIKPKITDIKGNVIEWKDIDINNPDHLLSLRFRNHYDIQSLAKSMEAFKAGLKSEYGGEGDTAASIALKALKTHITLDKFNKLYPVISGTPYDTVSRLAYNGGICQYSRHLIPGATLKNVNYIDINSSYPYTMTCDLPYGIPKPTTDLNVKYGEFIVWINFKIKGNNHPCIRCSSGNDIRKIRKQESPTYHKRSEFPLQYTGYLALNTYDIKLLDLYYEYDITVVEGWEYKTNRIFADFIHRLYNDKAAHKNTGNKVLEQSCKLILNALYGKFAQDLSGINEYITCNGKVHLYAEDTKKLYCPLSTCIVSHARYNLMKVVNTNPDNFIYCDTDSIIFFKKSLMDKSIIGKNLGQFSYEYDKIPLCKILGKKNYMLDTPTGRVLKCVGLPRDAERIFSVKDFQNDKDNWKPVNVEVDFNNFEIGQQFVIEKMRRVNGGIAMHYTTFTIKERLGIFG